MSNSEQLNDIVSFRKILDYFLSIGNFLSIFIPKTRNI